MRGCQFTSWNSPADVIGRVEQRRDVTPILRTEQTENSANPVSHVGFEDSTACVQPTKVRS